MISLGAAIVVVCVCLVAEAFFSGTEIALVSADRALLRRKATEGDDGAQLALNFLENPQRLLATTLLGTNLSVVVSSTVMTLAILGRNVQHGELIAVVVLSPLLLIFAEIVPKTLFQQSADRLVTRIVFPLRLAALVFAPLTWILGRFISLIARLLKVEERRALVTRDELRLLLDGGDGPPPAIPEGERELISNLLDFGDTAVYDVMVPLSEVTALPEDATLGDAAAEIADKQHTRIPVYRDRVDQIVGVLHAFDVLRAEAAGKKGTVADFARTPIYVPESKPTAALLVELKRGGHQLAVVVDEYGGATGICTVEDILEEIVGEIEDEHDRDTPAIRAEGPGVWRVPGRARVAQVNELLKISLPEGDDYESVAGLILERLKRLPREGELVKLGDVTLTVVSKSDRAIEEVRIKTMRKR